MPRVKITTTKEELHEVWDDLGVKQKFEANVGEIKVSKRFAMSIIDIFKENLDNSVLANILACDVGEDKKWFEYISPEAINLRCQKILGFEDGGLNKVLNELGISQDVDKILGQSQKAGAKNYGKGLEIW